MAMGEAGSGASLKSCFAADTAAARLDWCRCWRREREVGEVCRRHCVHMNCLDGTSKLVRRSEVNVEARVTPGFMVAVRDERMGAGDSFGCQLLGRAMCYSLSSRWEPVCVM
jgi:hypothetical protein